MKNLENITTVFSVMKGLNISIEDLVAYRNNQPAGEILPEQPSSSKLLPLEVLYENDYRSFFFEADKTPIAIIVGNIGVAFEDCPQEMNWYKASEYCEQYAVGRKKWQLPNKKAWHLRVLYKNKGAINKVLKTFGKEPLKEGWYWASQASFNGAWSARFSDDSAYNFNKYNNHYIRPVTVL